MRQFIALSFLLFSVSFASKSGPAPLPLENGDKYALPPQEVVGSVGRQTLDITLIPPEEYRMIVENRDFKDEVLEFADREEIERSNDEN